MELLKHLKKKIADQLIELLLALLAIPFAIFGIFLDHIVSLKIIEEVGSLLWSKLAVSLLAISILLTAYIFYQRPKLRFLQGLGVFVDPKSKQFFCPNCKAEKKIMHPLKLSSEGLKCSLCSFTAEPLSHDDIETVKYVKYATDWKNL